MNRVVSKVYSSPARRMHGASCFAAGLAYHAWPPPGHLLLVSCLSFWSGRRVMAPRAFATGVAYHAWPPPGHLLSRRPHISGLSACHAGRFSSRSEPSGWLMLLWVLVQHCVPAPPPAPPRWAPHRPLPQSRRVRLPPLVLCQCACPRTPCGRTFFFSSWMLPRPCYWCGNHQQLFICRRACRRTKFSSCASRPRHVRCVHMFSTPVAGSSAVVGSFLLSLGPRPRFDYFFITLGGISVCI